MSIDFIMPKLGHAMEEATIVAWRKPPGSKIERGDILLEVETDKAVLEVETTNAGVLVEILAQPGQTVAVGVPIAVIEQ